jgi:hypothetical protein
MAPVKTKLTIAGVILGLVVIACIPSLEDLASFPCANDGSCPRGLSCTPGRGCVRASIDSPCVAGHTDCEGAQQGSICALGLCTVPCDERRPCAAGHTCSSPPSAGEGACTPTCGDDESCPPGLACRPLGYGNARGCLGPIASSPLGGPCDTSEGCAGGGSAVSCHLGVCTVPCSPESPCDKGQLCSSYRGSGACLPECTNDERCAQGLECRPVGYERKKVCVGPAADVSSCSADLATDPAHCGTCERACKADQACAAGACVCAKTVCGDACADLPTDPRHCGQCGRDCNSGTCTGGQCQVGDLGPIANGETLLGMDAAYAYVDASTSSRWIIRRVSLRDKTSSTLVSHPTSTSRSTLAFDGTGFFASYQTPSSETVLYAAASSGVVRTLRSQGPPENWNSIGQLRGAIGGLAFVDAAPTAPCVFAGPDGGLIGWLDAASSTFPLLRAWTNYDCPYDLEGTADGGGESRSRKLTTAFDGDRLYMVSGTSLRAARLKSPLSGCQCCVGGWANTESEELRAGLSCRKDKNPDLLLRRLVGPSVVEMEIVGTSLFMLGGNGKLEKLDVLSKAVTPLADVRDPVAMIVTPSRVFWLDRGAGADGGVWSVPLAGGTPTRLALFPFASPRFSAVHSKRAFVWRNGNDLRVFTP